MEATESRDLGFSEPQPVIEVHHKGKKRVYLVLDSVIAERLGITEDDCRFSQAVAENGIICRLIRKGITA